MIPKGYQKNWISNFLRPLHILKKQKSLTPRTKLAGTWGNTSLIPMVYESKHQVHICHIPDKKISLWKLIPVPCCYAFFADSITLACNVWFFPKIHTSPSWYVQNRYPPNYSNKNNQELLHGSIVCLRGHVNKCDNCVYLHTHNALVQDSLNSQFLMQAAVGEQ